MKWTEYIPIAVSIVSVLAVVAGIIRDRRKPDLDQAQATSALVNSDSVKQQIKRMSDESNARRDLRILDLEEWADAMRPWASDAQAKFAMLAEMIRAELWDRGRPMPDIDLLPPPKFPPPRAI